MAYYGYGSYGYDYGYGYGAPGYQVSAYTAIHYGYGYYEVGARLVNGVNVTYAYYINEYGYAYQTYYGSGYYSDIPFYNIGQLNYAEPGKFDPFPAQYGYNAYSSYNYYGSTYYPS
jgi:hypothetical protein